ncbi:hypothetical protein SLA2020_046990 [Shorea laevis]
MEETSSRKEMTRPGAPAAVVSNPSFPQEAIKANLKGNETKIEQNRSTDGQVNGQVNGQVDEATASWQESSSSSTKEAVDPPPTSDPDPPRRTTTDPQAQVDDDHPSSDPPSRTTTDPQAQVEDDHPSSSTTRDDRPEIVSSAGPQRPGTSHGGGPQIN